MAARIPGAATFAVAALLTVTASPATTAAAAITRTVDLHLIDRLRAPVPFRPFRPVRTTTRT
jgi:hypothetical protein